MKIGVPKELFEGENRVAMTPESALMLQKLGYDCVIETKAGLAAGFVDKLYKDAGVEVVKTAAALWKAADIIAKVRQPNDTELKRLSADKTLISFFNPGGNEDGMEKAKKSGANVIAMEMVPRISRAQKMDALSSMANIAGYRAVIEAGNNFGRFFTGQVTAAGKVPPAKVLVVGGGVVGVNAARMAMGMGADVTIFDRSLERLKELDMAFGGRLKTIYSTEDAVEKHAMEADLIVGAVNDDPNGNSSGASFVVCARVCGSGSYHCLPLRTWLGDAHVHHCGCRTRCSKWRSDSRCVSLGAYGEGGHRGGG